MVEVMPPVVIKFIASTTESVLQVQRLSATFAETGAAVKMATREMSSAMGTSGQEMKLEISSTAASIIRKNEDMILSGRMLAEAEGRVASEWTMSCRQMALQTKMLADEVTAAEARAVASTEAMSAKMGTSAEANALAAGEAVKKVMMATALAGGVVAGISLKMAGDFESSTNRLRTSAGESEQGLEVVRKGILNLAGDVGVSAGDMSKAMYQIESASYHGEAGLGVLKAAMEGAKAEQADGVKVANALTSAMRDYYPHAKTAAEVTDAAALVMSKFVGATSVGKMTFDDLAGSLHTLLPAAMAANVSMDDALGALASMTVHGVSAEQATLNLAHALGHLNTITAPQAKEFALLGISAQKLKDDLSTKGLTGSVESIGNAIKSHMDSSGKVVLHLMDALKGLPPEIQKLGQSMLDGGVNAGQFTKATKGLTVEQQGQAAGFATLAKSTHGLGKEQKDATLVYQTYSEALKAAMGDQTGLNVALMIGGENMGYTNDAVKAITASTADAQGHVKGYAEVLGTFNQKMAQAEKGVGAVAIQIGNYLLPVASKIAGVFSDVTNYFSHNETAAKVLAIAIGTILVGALGAGIVGIVGWVKNLSAASTAMIGTTAKLGLLGAGLTLGLTNMDSFAGVATLVITGITGIGMAIDLIKGSVGAVGGLFGSAKAGISGFIGDVGLAEGALGKVKTVAGGLGSFLTGPWGLAIGLAVGAIALFSGGSKDASKAVDDLTKAIEQDSGQLGTNTRAWVANKLEKDGALASAKTLGFNEHDLTTALIGQGPALADVKQKLEDLVKAHTHQEAAATGGKGSVIQYHNVLDDTGKAAQGLSKEITGVSDSLSASKDAASRQSAALHESADALHDNAVKALTSTDAGKDLAATSKTVTDAMSAEKNEAKLLGDQLDFLNGGSMDATKTNIRFKDSVVNATDAIDKNGRTIDQNTADGRKNVSAILDAVGAANDHAKAVANQTHSMEAGKQAFEDDINGLKGILEKSHLSKAQIDELATSFMNFPPDIKRSVSVDVSEAMRNIKHVELAIDRNYQNSLKRGAKAGGLITRASGGMAHFGPGGPVSGPGSDTADYIPAMLSNDEFVQRASAVRTAGVGVMEALNAGNLGGAYSLLGQRLGASGMPRPSGGGGGGGGTTVVNVYPQNLVGTVNDLRDQMLTAFEQRGLRNGGKNTLPAFRH